MHGQVNTIMGEISEIHASKIVMDGMILISRSLAPILFDTSTMHSLTFKSFMSIFGLEPKRLDPPLFLYSATDYVQAAHVYRMCKITIGGVIKS